MLHFDSDPAFRLVVRWDRVNILDITVVKVAYSSNFLRCGFVLPDVAIFAQGSVPALFVQSFPDALRILPFCAIL